MGSHKKSAIEAKGSKRKSSYEKKVERVERLEKYYAENLSNLFYTIERGADQCLEVRIKIKPGGEWMGLVKRDGYPLGTICFSYGETFFECLDGLNVSVSQEKWREDKPWKGKG